MKKSVSILAISVVGIMSAFPSNGAQMTSQIRNLMEQKEERIKKLEECEGKKKGWMIAGISTIGLTAVGVGVNIAQAQKSKNLSAAIDSAQNELKDLKSSNPYSGGGGGIGGAQIDLSKYLDKDGDGWCHYQIDGYYKNDVDCAVDNPGDWKGKWGNEVVSGIAACSNLPGDQYQQASNSDEVQRAYSNTAQTSLPISYKYCYCKMTSPQTGSWIMRRSVTDASECTSQCSFYCAAYIVDDLNFKKAVFGL